MTPPNAIWPQSIECQDMNKSQGDFSLWSGATAHNTTPLTDKGGETRGYKIARAGVDAEKPRSRVAHFHRHLRQGQRDHPRQRRGNEKRSVQI